METTLTLPARAEPTIEFLHSSVTSARNANTARAYRKGLQAFATYLGLPDEVSALRTLLSSEQGAANALAFAWRMHLVERGLAPGSVNTRIAALRSIIKDARRFGLVNWVLDCPNVKAEAYRDTAGPGSDNYRLMLNSANKHDDGPRRRRDTVILRMLHDLGLRRKELVGIDLADIDFDASTVKIHGKGRGGKEILTVPTKTMDAIRAWMEVRGSFEGPLLVNLDRAAQNQSSGRRLSGASVYKIVVAYGKSVGVQARPHGLRHTSISTLLAKGIDVRTVQKFSRHKNVQTVCIYDDHVRDAAGEMANILSEG